MENKIALGFEESTDEDKYYIPDLEEFEGLVVYRELNGRQVRYQIGLDTDYDKLVEELKKNKIRVKYLDRFDIECLGFEYVEDSLCNYYIHSSGWKLDLKSEQEVCIFDDSHSDISSTSIIFEGVVKNISELRKLLKQLGIA